MKAVSPLILALLLPLAAMAESNFKVPSKNYSDFELAFSKAHKAWKTLRRSEETKNILETCRAGETGSTEDRARILDQFLYAIDDGDSSKLLPADRGDALDHLSDSIKKVEAIMAKPMSADHADACSGTFDTLMAEANSRGAELEAIVPTLSQSARLLQEKHKSINAKTEPFGPPIRRHIDVCDGPFKSTLGALNGYKDKMVNSIESVVQRIRKDRDRLAMWRQLLMEERKTCGSGLEGTSSSGLPQKSDTVPPADHCKNSNRNTMANLGSCCPSGYYFDMEGNICKRKSDQPANSNF